MKPPGSPIPIYREINECHEATGFPVRTELPEFHVFSMEDTYPSTVLAMPPFRRGFYQVTLFEEMPGTTVQLEGGAVSDAQNQLIFSPPEQVMSWVCGGNEKGFMLCFKPELLAVQERSIEEMFPFFEPTAPSVLPLATGDLNLLNAQFRTLCEASRATHAYRLPQLAGLTTAFLYECRHLHDRLGGNQPGNLGPSALVARFRQLVARCFTHHCSVESYAECLHVSADHLRAMVKKHTGRTVKMHVDERVLLEARRLLTHTELSVGEVAWHLQFGEPTHFARFFKRQSGRTPQEFRREARRILVTSS